MRARIFWIWLNFTGVVISLVVAYVVSALTKNVEIKKISNFNVSIKKEDFMIKEVYILVVFFIIIIRQPRLGRRFPSELGVFLEILFKQRPVAEVFMPAGSLGHGGFKYFITDG